MQKNGRVDYYRTHGRRGDRVIIARGNKRVLAKFVSIATRNNL